MNSIVKEGKMQFVLKSHMNYLNPELLFCYISVLMKLPDGSKRNHTV